MPTSSKSCLGQAKLYGTTCEIFTRVVSLKRIRGFARFPVSVCAIKRDHNPDSELFVWDQQSQIISEGTGFESHRGPLDYRRCHEPSPRTEGSCIALIPSPHSEDVPESGPRRIRTGGNPLYDVANLRNG